MCAICNPLCGGCPAREVFVICPTCQKLVHRRPLCEKCGATLSLEIVFCEAQKMDCSMPCRHVHDGYLFGRHLLPVCRMQREQQRSAS